MARLELDLSIAGASTAASAGASIGVASGAASIGASGGAPPLGVEQRVEVGLAISIHGAAIDPAAPPQRRRDQ
jgi:hypothetical protein